MSHGEFLKGLRWGDLPQPVQHQARRCLKDVLATSAGSLALPSARNIEALVAAQFGQGPAPLFFRGPRTTLAGASFGNALRIDGLDCHDGFRPNKGHAGATVVPVLLAAAELSRPSGAELLTALVAGYEIALRAGLALHATYAPAYHGSGAWTALGAAAAGALLLGVPADEIDAVLGAAEYYGPMSPILRCTVHPSIVKDGAGAGAWAAAMALAMHGQGMTGLPSLFVDEPKGREHIASLGKRLGHAPTVLQALSDLPVDPCTRGGARASAQRARLFRTRREADRGRILLGDIHPHDVPAEGLRRGAVLPAVGAGCHARRWSAGRRSGPSRPIVRFRRSLPWDAG